MSTVSDEDPKWIWHMRYGHLNFRSLSYLSSKSLVSGLTVLDANKKTCEVCIKGKQSRLLIVGVSNGPQMSECMISSADFDLLGIVLKLDPTIDSVRSLGHWFNGRTIGSLVEPHV